MINDKNYYLDLFSVTEDGLRRLTEESLRSGGDYADLYFENSVFSDLLLRDGDVNTGVVNVDFGAGIRVLKGEKTGYAYSESTEPSALLSAARAAALIAERDASAGCVAAAEGTGVSARPRTWSPGSNGCTKASVHATAGSSRSSRCSPPRSRTC